MRSQGSAMLIAIFFLALLTGLGITLLTVSEVNLKTGRGSLNNKQSFYLAESGVENGRRELFDANGGGEDFSSRIDVAAGDDEIIDFDPDTLVAEFDADGQFVGFSGYNDDVPLFDAEILGEGVFSAFLTNDPIDGRTNLTDTNGRASVTGVGLGPNRALKLIEALIEPEILMPPIPPAAVTLVGSSPSFSGGNSGAAKYNGEDCHYLGGGQPGLNVGILGATDALGDSALASAIANPAKYISGSYNGVQTGIDLTDATDPLLVDSGMPTLDPIWKDCNGLGDLMDRIRDSANYYCSGSCTLPSLTGLDDIVFVDGDIQVGPGYAGSGILAATGVITVLGNSTWTGIVLAIGEGRVIRMGGGNGVISGATVVADTAGANGLPGDADDCQPVFPSTDPFGQSTYSVTGGGNSDVDFCTRFFPPEPRSYRIVEFRQR